MFFGLPGASVSLVLQHPVHADAAQQEKDPGVPQSGQERPPESIPIKEGIRQPPPGKGNKIAGNKADAVPSGQYVLPGLHGAADAALCAGKAHKADKRKPISAAKKVRGFAQGNPLLSPQKSCLRLSHDYTAVEPARGGKATDTSGDFHAGPPQTSKKEKFVEFY